MTGNRIRLSDFSVRVTIQYSTFAFHLYCLLFIFFSVYIFQSDFLFIFLSVSLPASLNLYFSLSVSFISLCFYLSHFSLLWYYLNVTIILSDRSSLLHHNHLHLSLSFSLLLDSQNLPRNWLLYFKNFFFFYIHIGKSLAGGNFVSRCKTSENRLGKICFLLHGNC